ncbi:DUF4178 domain-containing protein [Sphingopyxis sp.]|uniref:DUF4178 domain-containing protein n=1 Tax=Sphingopyxis sp. TaxID=1908224 RepID=UPI003D1430B0
MTAERAITCPSCGGSIAIKAAGHSVSLGCQYCGALIDVAHPDVAVIAKYRTALQGLPIPLGTRGTLFGTEWEVIGALARNDGDVYWTEFLLFNPYGGYRWLVHSEDEWQFGTMLLDRPIADGRSALWRGARYDIDYDPVTTTTDRVVGEFYWRVRAGDRVTASTYSSGNDMLSAEWTNGEINWTQLVSLSEANIRASFGLQPAEPADGGWDDDDDGGGGGLGLLGGAYSDFTSARGMRQDDLMKMFLMGLATLFASLVVMIGFGISTQSVENSLNVAVDGEEQSLKIGTLTIGRSYQPVTIEARSSSFDNRWIDLDYMLVDQATQRAHTAYGVVERYSGSDGDGPWTEGGYSATVKFGSIPRGTYDVVVDAGAHAWPAPLTSQLNQPAPSGSDSRPWDIQQPAAWSGGENVEVHFQASAGGVMWSNLWLEMALLFGMPLIILWWRSD